MANAAENFSTMAGNLKPVFGKVINLMPEVAIYQKMFPYAAEAKTGKYYEFPFIVKYPWGLTMAGSSGALVDLNDARNGQTEDCQINSYEQVLRNQVSYALLDRAAEAGKQAFVAAGKLIGEMMATQVRNIKEMLMIHGQTGLMTAGAAVAGQVVTFSDETWSPGLAAVLEGAVVDFFQSDLSTVRQAGVVVSSVDLDAKTITFTGTLTGITTGDVMFLKGSLASGGAFSEQTGLYKQISAQTGTLFNINKATYSAYRGSVTATVGGITPGKLLRAVSKIINKGFVKGTLYAAMPPITFGELNAQAMAGRVFDKSYSVTVSENGSDGLKYHGNGVTVECLSHPFYQEGKIILHPQNPEWFKNGGAVDVSFNIPGSQTEYYVPIANATGVEFQGRWDSFFAALRPNWCGVMTGVTHTAS